MIKFLCVNINKIDEKLFPSRPRVHHGMLETGDTLTAVLLLTQPLPARTEATYKALMKLFIHSLKVPSLSTSIGLVHELPCPTANVGTLW